MMSEISNENLAELNKRYRTTVFIVLGQIFVLLFLMLAANLFVSQTQANLSEKNLTTLWVMVLFLAIGSFLLRRLFSGWERLKNIFLLKGIPGVLGNLQRNSIILSFFPVAVMALGYLLSLYSGNSADLLRAGAIALVVFLINFPRKKIWKTIISNLGKV